MGGAAALTRTIAGGASGSVGRIAVSYAYALVPFGFGMWLAHYGFHLLTGLFTVIPIAQNVVVDLLGWPALGEPLWRLTGMRPGSVFPIQVGFILLGAMGSLALAYRISERDYPDRPGAADRAVGDGDHDVDDGGDLDPVAADGDERRRVPGMRGCHERFATKDTKDTKDNAMFAFVLSCSRCSVLVWPDSRAASAVV